MSGLKPMSAAQYRANAEKIKADRPTEIVQLKSGSVFELRRPDLHAYMVTGRLPQSLVHEGMKAWRSNTPAEKIASELDDEDVMDSLIFMREIVHDCTVSPRFVEFATEDNQISAADMLIEDFNEIFAWAMGHQGVAGITGLHTFPEGRTRGSAGARAHGKKQRRKSKQPIETVGSVQ
jgi:hypothetical protein